MGAKYYRHTAWNALSQKWGMAIIACLIASFVGGTSIFSTAISFNYDFNVNISGLGSDKPEININWPSTEHTTEFTSWSDFISSTEIKALLGILIGAISLIAIIAFITLFIKFCIGSIVEVGYSQFNIDIIDGKEAKIQRLFSFFKHWSSAVVANLLRTLYTILWSFLFIIPGIIATYSYSMTPYILAENPEMSPKDAIARSKELMNGSKWDLFCLMFSFIGWDILCILTLGILNIWISPYKHAALAAFYRSLVAAPVEMNDDVDFESEQSSFDQIDPEQTSI